MIRKVDQGYMIEAVDPERDISEFLVKGYLTDKVEPKSKTEFTFKVTIFNDPPKFKIKKLEVLKVT